MVASSNTATMLGDYSSPSSSQINVPTTSLTPRHICSLLIPAHVEPTLSSSFPSSFSASALPSSTPAGCATVGADYHQVKTIAQNKLSSSALSSVTNFSTRTSNAALSHLGADSTATTATSLSATPAGTGTLGNKQRAGSKSNLVAAGGGSGGVERVIPSSDASISGSVTNNNSVLAHNTNTANNNNNNLHHRGGNQTTATATSSSLPSSSSWRPTSSLPSPENPQITPPMMVAFAEYLLVPTVGGKIYVYEIAEFDDSPYCSTQSNSNSATAAAATTATTTGSVSASSTENNQDENSILDGTVTSGGSVTNMGVNNNNIGTIGQNLLEPICEIGPFFVGEHYNPIISSDSNPTTPPTTAPAQKTPATIVAICCTDVPYTHKNVKSQSAISTTTPEVNTDNNNTNTNINGITCTKLGTVTVLSLEGDVNVLEFHQIPPSKISPTSPSLSSSNVLLGVPSVSTMGNNSNYTNTSNSLGQSNHSITNNSIGGGANTDDGGGNKQSQQPTGGEVKAEEEQELKLSVQNVTSFFSGHLGATCMTYHQHPVISGDHEVNDNDNTLNLRIAVGHENGSITDFELVSTDLSSSIRNDQDDHNQQQRQEYQHFNHDCIRHVELKWEGHFDTPIRSISSLGRNHQHRLSVGDNAITQKLRNSFLVVGLEQVENIRGMNGIPRDILSFNTCLEVINVSEIETTTLEEESPVVEKHSNKTHNYSIPLESFCTWPEIGMELQDFKGTFSKDDCSSIFTPSPVNRRGGGGSGGGSAQSNNITSTATHAIRGYDESQSVNIIETFQGDDPAFSSVLSNGNVATLHSFMKKSTNNNNESKLSWGLCHLRNQIALPQPCIGLGLFDNTDLAKNKRFNWHNNDPNLLQDLKHEHSIICCLRGGTVFVVPVIPLHQEKKESSKNSFHEICMYQCPNDFDGDSDNLVRYVQGFTAAYTIVKTRRTIATAVDGKAVGTQNGGGGSKRGEYTYRAQPLLFYAWPGGIIDVYACGLSVDDNMCRKDDHFQSDLNGMASSTLFQMLISNGTITALINLLLSIPKDKLQEGSLFQKAIQECKSIGDTAESITDVILQEGNENLDSFSAVLHQLVSGNEPIHSLI